MVKPEDDSVNKLTPSMAIPNSPEVGLYIPVEDSEAKLREGAPTVPLTKEMLVAPAAIVEAFKRFTESQSRITCSPAGTVAVPPPAPVVKVI
jgi:hypothetical protein